VTAELVREATYDGRLAARIRCYDGEGGTSVVEAKVTPIRGGTPIERGPYTFATAQDALRFVQEAVLTLQYLGCAIE
jgi:hypothetical protein